MFNTSAFNEGRKHSDSCTCELKLKKNNSNNTKEENKEKKEEKKTNRLVR